MGKLFKVVCALLVIGAVWYGVQSWFASYKEADAFKKKLDQYGKPNFSLPAVEEKKDGELYRTGRVLMVIPERRMSQHNIAETMIHSAWHALPETMRARKPSEVATLIRVTSGTTKGRMYQKQGGVELKYVPRSTVVLDIFDWKNQRYIGQGILDPGEFTGEVMEGKDLDAMKAKVDVKAIADFVKALPVKY